MTRAPRVAIIGAGASGLCLAMRLRRAGFHEFTIYEKAAALGGTWRDNTYPGAGCDIPAHLYRFSFEPNPAWPRKYATQPEILAYLQGCAARNDLLPHLRLGTEIVRLELNQAAGTWALHSAAGDHDEADVVVAATGQLDRPAIPDLPGLSRFEGTVFHSARWDHGHDLRGEDVAVIGTGASAVQLVPHVADVARSLTVFQRTPNYVVPKLDRLFTRVELAAFTRVPPAGRLYRWLVYWSYESRFVAFRHPRLGALMLEASLRRAPSGTRPDYPLGCKRILISSDWYPTLRRPTVTLVTDPIESISSDAILTTGGARHRADTIVLATGFESTRFLGDIEVTGAAGAKLADVWSGGAWAYRGMVVPGFPNLFLLYGPNTNLGHNSILFMVERQVGWILRRLRALERTGATAVDVDLAAARAYDRALQRRMGRIVWSGPCRSWYKTASGRVTNNWPGYTVRYWAEMARPDPHVRLRRTRTTGPAAR